MRSQSLGEQIRRCGRERADQPVVDLTSCGARVPGRVEAPIGKYAAPLDYTNGCGSGQQLAVAAHG